MTAPEDLVLNYRVALLRYLPRREEEALTAGYEIGRSAVTRQVTILELAQVHHDVHLGILEETADEDRLGVAAAASEFFLEVLATFDMAQRALPGGDAAQPRTDGAA